MEVRDNKGYVVRIEPLPGHEQNESYSFYALFVIHDYEQDDKERRSSGIWRETRNDCTNPQQLATLIKKLAEKGDTSVIDIQVNDIHAAGFPDLSLERRERYHELDEMEKLDYFKSFRSSEIKMPKTGGLR